MCGDLKGCGKRDETGFSDHGRCAGGKKHPAAGADEPADGSAVLTDAGITPGSGIGNHRNAINRKSVGVPVISLGVPTVVDAATIVSDAMTEFISALSLSDLQKLDERERQELARELLSPQLNGLFVTPKNIDDSIKNLSFLISEGLNIALLGDKEE